MYSDIYRPISFKVGMIIEITNLWILVSVWMTLTFIHGHSCMKRNASVSIFLEISLLILTNFRMLLQLVDLLKLKLNLFCTNNIQGRKHCWHDFIKYTVNIVLCWDISEPICFKLDMMWDMTILYSLIPVWMTLKLTQGHRKARTCAVVLL